MLKVFNNVQLTIRVCSLESMDNSCGMFRYQNELMKVTFSWIYWPAATGREDYLLTVELVSVDYSFAYRK